MTTPQRADRCGWRRRARSRDRWEMVVTLSSCTPGEIWDLLQKECFFRVGPDTELNREWEYAITLAGEKPALASHDGSYQTRRMSPR